MSEIEQRMIKNFLSGFEAIKKEQDDLPKSIRLSVYETQDCFDIFRPGEPITRDEHKKIMRKIAAIVKERYGIKAELFTIKTADYLFWLADKRHNDTPASRAMYIAEFSNKD